MKRKVSVWFVALLFLSAQVFASVTFNESSEVKLEFGKVDYALDEGTSLVEKDLTRVVNRYVPEKYRAAFYYYTDTGNAKETVDLRVHLLAIGDVESSWTPAISDRNRNGSYDIGYLQLNSYNIADPYFVWRYEPKPTDKYAYNKKDKFELYLIMCIKLYKRLYSVYGGDAVYCYNCGETRYSENTIPQSTLNYRDKIVKKANLIYDELNEKSNERRLAVLQEKMQYRSMRPFIDIAFCHSNSSSFDLSSGSHRIYNTDDVVFIDKHLMAYILSILNDVHDANVENDDYVFVGGYKKSTGAFAPVFLYRPTGRLEYC